MEVNWLDESEKPMDQVTLEQFEELCNLVCKQKAYIKTIETTLDTANEHLKKLSNQVAHIFEKFGKTSHKSAMGTISLVNLETYTTPKTREEKEALFNYMKSLSEDVYWAKVGVNHQSLQAFCKEEMAAALEKGDTAFRVPGVGEPTLLPQIRVKLAKG